MKHISTNDWEILKGERIPRWPSKIGEKRPIHVNISSWIGLSVGAKHFNLVVEEEDNQWWCEDENAWVRIFSDSSSKGYSLNASCMEKEEAVKLAKFFIDIVAGKKRKNHEIKWDN